MTAIKQISITTEKHAANLAKYLNDDRVLARGSQNLSNEERWESEMARTRTAYGHDVPSRAGAANTILVHQTINFLPEECSCNGGKMTPEKCMGYAREYIATRYANYESIFVLHQEHCSADGIDRFSVHLAVNRSNLKSGNRLNEGRSKNAKIERANAIRDMDRKYGLSQLREGERNSRIHARQPSRAEREMTARGIRTDKSYMRDAIRASVREAKTAPSETNRVRALADSLEAKGVKMSVTNNKKDFMFERKSAGTKSRGYKLGRGYSMPGIIKGLGITVGRFMARAIEEDMER